MKKFSVLFCTAVLVAALSAWSLPQVVLSQEPPEARASGEPNGSPNSGPMQIVDERPQRELRNYNLSGNFFGCANGIWNLGDHSVGSDRLVRLERMVRETLGAAAEGQQLIVQEYHVYLNARARLEWVATGNPDGSRSIVGDMMARGQPDASVPTPTLRAKCEQERTPAGWFDTSEIENNHSPLVVQITIRVAGEIYTVRSVYSHSSELFGAFWRQTVTPVMASAVNAAIDKAHTALAEEIGRRATRPTE